MGGVEIKESILWPQGAFYTHNHVQLTHLLQFSLAEFPIIS